MIGTKKLDTIRQELQTAIAATGEDPLRWLEARITGSERQIPATAGEGEVLSSLRRFLETPPLRKGRKQRQGAKK